MKFVTVVLLITLMVLAIEAAEPSVVAGDSYLEEISETERETKCKTRGSCSKKEKCCKTHVCRCNMLGTNCMCH
uniref:U25-Eretoxin-Ek1a_2 n=1 Tax=Eresus cinnaberinus TaxID=175337 RepID=A0A2D0PC75_ERECI